MLTVTIILSGILHVILALLVYSKRRNSLTNITFSLLVAAELGWVLANYATLSGFELIDLLTAVRLILLFVVAQNTLFLVFSEVFPDGKWSLSYKKTLPYLLLSGITGFLTLTPYVFKTVNVKSGIPVTDVGPAMSIFVIHAAISITAAFRALVKKYKPADILHQRQLKFILLASAINWIVIPITNFLFTQLFKTTFFIEISPLYTLAFLSLIAYTIIAQRLFDIRAVVARSVAYALVLGTMSLIYSLLVFGLINSIFSGPHNEALRQVLSVGSVVPILLSFQAAKNYFDTVTKKLFFRDAYDPQTLLDELNKLLVTSTDVSAMLQSCSTIIQSSLKTSSCVFFVRSTSYFPDRLIGLGAETVVATELESMQEILPKIKHKIFSADKSPSTEFEQQLNSAMAASNIEVIVRLVNTLEYELIGVGEIFIGPKQNGSQYTKQDLKILEIIANELVIAIENALRYEEIEEFNVTLQKKIDDATRELKRSNDKLRALDEAKDEFVSMASHQLRTPLTSIKGYISMVSEGDVGKLNEEQKKMLSQALFSSQRMVYLIADLLNVSRLRTGKFVIETKPTYLPSVIESEISQLTEGAAAKDITLQFEKPSKFPTLNLDEMKIRQVIMNFTDNAIYYTPSGGKITISLKDKKDTVEFTVKDTGIGVPADERHKLFTKFYRANNARKARPDGTGLGLFMAKKVVVAQGGSIIFQSKEGKGSTFGFSFPKARLEVKDFKKQ